ncbi:thermonuclease family protein [Devosia submarina]|uniref:thermonuclease family protein n=1 Tax=Devosia submarina TaxID=1173082 RepID=UPI0013002301|nr:thermonuclease family protein [Devosia submarina]
MAIIVLAAAALVAAYLEPAPKPLQGSARASDGDSFRLGDERVRLLGIDAPELQQTCRDEKGRDWPCGLAARDRMAALLAEGGVDCRPEGHDQYGRLLSTCTVRGRDLALAMVSEGLAISADKHKREEQAARQARRGIWRGGFDLPRDWRRDHADQNGAWSWLGFLGL